MEEENDTRSKNLTVVTSSPQLDVMVSREFNPSGNAGFTIMFNKESLTTIRKFNNDKESLTDMRSLLLMYKESSMQIPVHRNPPWPKK